MKLEKLRIGNFVNFVESGKTIGGVEVSKAAFPSADPPENWPSLGCVLESNIETEKESDDDYCPSPSGGYDKITDEYVVGTFIKFKTRETGEPYWRMALGLDAEIVNGTAQTPFNAKQREIYGWLKVALRGQDGADRAVMNVWGKLMIDENPKYSKDPTKPGYSFQVLQSDVATVEPNGIV